MIILVPWLLAGWHSSHPAGWSVGLGALLLLIGGGISLQATMPWD